MSELVLDLNHTAIVAIDIQKSTAVLPDLPRRSVMTNGVFLVFAARCAETRPLLVQIG